MMATDFCSCILNAFRVVLSLVRDGIERRRMIKEKKASRNRKEETEKETEKEREKEREPLIKQVTWPSPRSRQYHSLQVSSRRV